MAILQTPTAVEETDPEASNDGTEEVSTDDSERVESLGNETLSSSERSHPYEGRVLGEVAANGKEVMEFEVPEYKNKKCMVCRGKFNIRSKYQICKICDKLVHVNNNKRCYKMKKYVKDKNFVCCNCVDKPEDTDANNTAADESGLNKTYTVNNSMYYMDLTLNGFPAAGLVFDELPPRDDQGNTGTEETAAEDSISIHTDTEVDDLDDCEEVLTASFQCAECVGYDL